MKQHLTTDKYGNLTLAVCTAETEESCPVKGKRGGIAWHMEMTTQEAGEVSGKLAAAEDGATSPEAMLALAYDNNAIVRYAVAKRQWFPVSLEALTELTKDEDERVAKVARERYLQRTKLSYSTPDASELKTLLVGKTIVGIHKPDQWGSGEGLVLSDGTVLLIEGNEGCGGCGDGNYWVEKLNTHDQMITNVTVQEQELEDKDVINIFVYSGKKETLITSIEGNQGNGYYGYGYTLVVRPVLPWEKN